MKIPRIMKNRYFWIVFIFLIIMLFFDSNSMIRQVKLNKNLREARATNTFYKEEIKRHEELLKKLNTDKDFAEKYAREKYLMKRDDEDVYVVVEE